MSQITLRGLDPDMEKKIRISVKSGKSINRIILDIINKHMGEKRTKKCIHRNR